MKNLARLLYLNFCMISFYSHSVGAAAFITDDQGRRIELNHRLLPPGANECHFCHTSKSRQFIGKKTQTELEHQNKESKHGKIEIKCHSCHDINHSNYLISTLTHPADFENSSAVCQRCHADRYRDWRNGIHGKRVGSWQNQTIQYHCIDCHDPHSVKFKSMKAYDLRSIPKFLIRKHDESEPGGHNP